MTDKELRKLSRLELLELLLDASKENRELKEKIEILKAESKTAQNIENLSMATRHVEEALRYANSITDALKTAPEKVAMPRSSVKPQSFIAGKDSTLSDKDIYRRILCFFANNDEKLSVFPSDIENDVRERIKSIINKRKIN